MSCEAVNPPRGEAEKQRVALTSLLAAVGLTGAKLTIGIWTNSLGILSEAAHSGLDLVAAAVTLWAVRISAQPADQEHTYGHGKFENLSALFETLLLLATCVWIIYEAVQRLAFRHHADVTVNSWAFLVVIASIVVDYSRSRALLRVAKKYHSQALEADALHFSTDIWSSLVVLLGLIAVAIGERFGWPWLESADAVAALGVALIVVGVSVQLGIRSVNELLDKVPQELPARLADAASSVPGVEQVKQVRVRRSGAETFADMTLTVNHGTLLDGAHAIADQAESAVRAVLPAIDVVVHLEPAAADPLDVFDAVRTIAARQRVAVHDVRNYYEQDQHWLELHVEVDPALRLGPAHEVATQFEKALLAALPNLARVVTHIEPADENAVTLRALPASEAAVREAVQDFIRRQPRVSEPHRIEVRVVGGGLTASLHCRQDADTNVVEAHRLTQELESFLHQRVPQLQRVIVHVEPTKRGQR